jgi:hypothetical protein
MFLSSSDISVSIVSVLAALKCYFGNKLSYQASFYEIWRILHISDENHEISDLKLLILQVYHLFS